MKRKKNSLQVEQQQQQHDMCSLYDELNVHKCVVCSKKKSFEKSDILVVVAVLFIDKKMALITCFSNT
ncbi:hypothetical protein DERP_011569 [Dermatophagoides pteronyssinus]|uniref:Uncharacterized protein n=1 Tax=Dermatophagoides pteronyssinus TaxID=6956 RepID=A0ABQ8JC86_DERPT|nr:hypothetical protein DERP_011569 [Dermatophagoides pteronyssinus]